MGSVATDRVIAYRLRSIRIMLGWTGPQMADALGICVETLYAREREEHPLRLEDTRTFERSTGIFGIALLAVGSNWHEQARAAQNRIGVEHPQPYRFRTRDETDELKRFVLEFAASGISEADIASDLGLALKTVHRWLRETAP